MRTTILLHFGLFLLLGLTARAQNYTGSSKACYSKSTTRSGNAISNDDAPMLTGGRLARVTAYWPGEDHWTTRRQSASGVRLRLGFCAVDSRIIPYGSIVTISGLGAYLAVDTGTAVISRQAARESGQTREERHALVVDLFFPSRKLGERFAREGPKFAMVAWQSAETIARD
jgi:hypothetical protein